MPLQIVWPDEITLAVTLLIVIATTFEMAVHATEFSVLLTITLYQVFTVKAGGAKVEF